jgi:hypothetical protein
MIRPGHTVPRQHAVQAVLCSLIALVFLAVPASAEPAVSKAGPIVGPREDMPVYYHLRQGITFYLVHANDEPFTIQIDLKDINLYSQGPQTALVKLYDPAGNVLHDEDIPDDGITDGGYNVAFAGWDHEVWTRGVERESGTEFPFRADAFSNPQKLEKIKGATRTIAVKNAPKGVYQLQMAGCDDHFVKLGLPPDMKMGVLGHPDFIAGDGEQFHTSYLYVPVSPLVSRDRGYADFWLIEHAYPRTRKITAFLGEKQLTFTDIAYKTDTTTVTADQALGRFTLDLKKIPAGSVIKLVNEGTGSYLFRIHGVPGILCPDEYTAKFIAGGITQVPAGPVVSFPWQRELWESVAKLKKEDFRVSFKPGTPVQGATPAAPGEWNKMAAGDITALNVHAWRASANPYAVDAVITQVNALLDKPGEFNLNAFMEALPAFPFNDPIAFETLPVKGNALYHNVPLKNIIQLAMLKDWLRFRCGEVIWQNGELNVAYHQGFGWDGWEYAYEMRDVLDEPFRAALVKGVTNIGERMSYANGLERVLSNGRTTMQLNLYYAFLFTGNLNFKMLSERYLERMMNASDDPYSGRSPSGYFREQFGPDGGYCTYPLYQLGRLYTISNSPRAYEGIEGLCRWMCYVNMPNGPGAMIGPTSWNSRISASSSEHIWGDGFKYLANKSPWAATLYRWRYPQATQYDVADPEYEAGKPMPAPSNLVLASLTRGVLPSQKFPAEWDKPFFEDVGNGHEFFAVRRGQYYALVFAGRRPPFWLDRAQGGQLCFSGGGIAGLYVHGGANTVLLGRVNKEYGWPAERWNEMPVPVAAGTLTDGAPFNTGVCRCTPTVDKETWTLKTTGEAIGAPVNFDRVYRFNEANIDASIVLKDADLARDVFQYREHFRKNVPTVAQAWELIPYQVQADTKVTMIGAGGAVLGTITEKAEQTKGEAHASQKLTADAGVAGATEEKGVENVAVIEIANAKGGIRIKLDKPRTVRLSATPGMHDPAIHGPEWIDHRSRAAQVKFSDKIETGGQAELKYVIEPVAVK